MYGTIAAWDSHADRQGCFSFAKGSDLGLLEKIVPKGIKSFFARPSEQQVASGFRTFTEYSPAFTSWDGNLYEQAQTRAIVERFAVACSKLKPEFVTPEGSGGALPRVQRMIATQPNDYMSWPSFLYRAATLYEVETTLFIVPQYDLDGSKIGLFPMKPHFTELVEYEGEPWLRFHLMTGETQAFPFYDVIILAKFQLESDIFGGGNIPLTPTLRLMDAQRQAEEIALQTGADIRFIGKVTTNMHEEDLDQYRDRFSRSNFGPNNKSALILHDNRIEQLKQVDPQHYTIDPEEMARIDKALYAYFGINEAILTNSFTEEQWGAWYESRVEPFALALSERMSISFLTKTQRLKGNKIMFSSSYLEYASPKSKREMVKDMAGMSIITINEGRDILQLPHIKGGDVRIMRGEYYMLDEENRILAESGGHTDHSTSYGTGWDDDLSDLDEPDDE